MTQSRPLPPHAAAYFDRQLQGESAHSTAPSTLSRLLFWYQNTVPTRPPDLRRAMFPFVVALLFVLFLREEFWLAVDRADWRAMDRRLTFAGQWFLGLVVLYIAFELLLAFNCGALDALLPR